MPKKKRYISWLRKKQEKQTNGKPSTKMNSEEHNSLPPQQQQESPSAYSLHSSIRTLIYDDWITILEKEELKPLIISGQPPIDELVSAWDSITDEYTAAIKTPKSNSIFDCYKKIERTKEKIKVLDWILFLLEFQYDEDLANELVKHGYSLITLCDDKEEYLKKINRVRTKAKTLIVLLGQYQNEYNLLAPDDNKVKRDRQSYIDELAILAKYQGGGFIDPRKITVEIYISIVNSFMRYQESLNRQQEKKNG